MREFDSSIDPDLSYQIFHNHLLPRPDDLSKPLLVYMILQLFQAGVFDVKKIKKEDKKQLTRTELYLYFLNNLSTNVKRRSIVRLDPKKRQIFRYFLRKFAAKRQLNELNPTKTEKGINIEDFQNNLNSTDEKLYQEIEKENFHLISHFGVKGNYLEFIHLSFREYLVAEYLLEVLLLNTKDLSNKFQLHIGYVSDETINFFNGLVAKFKYYLNNPKDEEEAKLFDDFLRSVQIGCDENLERYFDTENQGKPIELLKIDKLKERLWNKTLEWAEDETVYFTTWDDNIRLLGQPIQIAKTPLSQNHIFCERWYCVIFLYIWMEQGEEIDMDWDNLLQESENTLVMNPTLLEYSYPKK